MCRILLHSVGPSPAAETVDCFLRTDMEAVVTGRAMVRKAGTPARGRTAWLRFGDDTTTDRTVRTG